MYPRTTYPRAPLWPQMYTPQQLVKGMYAEFLPAWLAVWPRDRFLFFRTEDYKAAPVPHITATMKFLGACCVQGPVAWVRSSAHQAVGRQAWCGRACIVSGRVC